MLYPLGNSKVEKVGDQSLHFKYPSCSACNTHTKNKAVTSITLMGIDMATNGTNGVKLPATQKAAQFNPKDKSVLINEVPVSAMEIT